MTLRAWWTAVAVAAAHFVVQVAAMVSVIGDGMARFDDAGDPSGSERFLAGIASLAQFPLVSLVRSLPLGGTGHWGWPILLANSALWGAAVIVARHLAVRRWRAGVRGRPAATRLHHPPGREPR